MEWTFIDTWIVVTGALSAMSCGLLGNYLVLRRMSMMGDAISHAVLPGLAIAFLITGSRDSLPMLVGAIFIGVLTALLIQGLSRLSGVEKGAAMGVVFTTLFALGLILIRQAADHVDLDPGCVLYGAIELTPLDTVVLFGQELPQATVTNGAMLLINLAFVVLFFKELKITSFDPALATTMGISAELVHYGLMALIAATTIAAFESVGSILVIAMLIVPGATAHLLTDRMPWMIGFSLVLAALSAVIGHLGAITVPTWFGFRDTSTAGMMAVAAGCLFLLAFMFAPRYGVMSRTVHRILLSVKITSDDILGFLYRFQEMAPTNAAPVSVDDVHETVKGGALSRLALWSLSRKSHLRVEKSAVRLTETGLKAAANLVRTHRLWESYLCNKRGFCETDVHYTAHRLEHFTDTSLQKNLAAEAGDPSRDPHQRPIPEQ